MDERLPEYWQELSDFITYRNTIDLGAITNLLECFLKNVGLDASGFPNQLLAVMTAVSEQTKSMPSREGDILVLLSIDCLLNNLYFYNKSNDSFKPNSSTLYGWMSSSQMSIDANESDERETNAIAIANSIANSELLFKKLKFLIDRNNNKQKYKKYIDLLLQTVDFILGKSGLSKETFMKLRTKYIGIDPRRLTEANFKKVNQVVFSSQLNKVLALLTQGDNDVHSSLLRIYIAGQLNSESRYFQGVIFSGEEMIMNLYRYYINSFKDIGQIFQQSKHPLFRFAKNHLALLFTPTLRRFHQMVAKIGAKCGSQSGGMLYQSYHVLLQNQLGNFLNLLPSDLLKLLNQFKELIDQNHPSDTQISTANVKKLFFYSFLTNQPLIQQVYPRLQPSKLSSVYSHVVHLFFQNSIKKFSNLSQNQTTIITKLIQKLADRLDQLIIEPNLRVDQDQPVTFKIRQSLLNYDYEVALQLLSSLQFTPKDSKQFQMKRTADIIPESPVYKHFKGQKSKIGEGEEQLELVTWMSVGGSRQWGAKQNKVGKGRVAERLKGFKTIGVKIRSELQNESQQFRSYYLRQ